MLMRGRRAWAVWVCEKRVHVALTEVIHAHFRTQTRSRRARLRHGGDPGRVPRRPARHPSPRAPTSEPGGRPGAMRA
eukprot:5322872-Prymnesium_polylepis.1